MDEPKLVMIEWLDTQTTGGWFKDPLDAPPSIVYSIGFLAHEDKMLVRLAGSLSGDWGDITTIPVPVIMGRREITLKELHERPGSTKRGNRAKRGRPAKARKDSRVVKATA